MTRGDEDEEVRKKRRDGDFTRFLIDPCKASV